MKLQSLSARLLAASAVLFDSNVQPATLRARGGQADAHHLDDGSSLATKMQSAGLHTAHFVTRIHVLDVDRSRYFSPSRVLDIHGAETASDPSGIRQ